MSQKSGTPKSSSERIVKDVRELWPKVGDGVMR